MNEFEEIDKIYAMGLKIRNFLENRDFPEDLKFEIEKVYREYEQFYDENVKSGIHLHGVETDYEDERDYSISKILEDYRNECGQKAEEIITYIENIEKNDEDKELTYLQKQNRIEDYYEEMNKNDNRASNIANTVADSISNSERRLFSALSIYTIDKKEKDELESEIHSIKHRAETRLEEEGNAIFAKDDKEIENKIIEIYEEFFNEKIVEIGDSEEKQELSESEKFRKNMAINPENLKPIEKIEKTEKQKEDKEFKPDVILR